MTLTPQPASPAPAGINPEPNYSRTTLANGIRVVSERLEHVRSISLGVWVRGGSQLEPPEQAGITHYIEHMLFKGTRTRDAARLAQDIESVGGRIDAETEKEFTVFSVKVLAEHLPIAVDVLADMLLCSALDPREMTNEKKVVLEEIKSYQDAPDELVHDLFAETLWQHHPLGRPVIGTYDTVARLTREDVAQYIRSNYVGSRMVVAACGLVDHDRLCSLVEQSFGECPAGTRDDQHTDPPTVSHRRCVAPKDTEQVHFCFGTRGYSMYDDRRYPLAVIDAVLSYGGSSRLFQEIREKRGLSYSVGSYVVSYRDAGCFAVAGSTSPENADEVVGLAMSELAGIRRGNVTPEELDRAKNQMRTAVLFSQESVGGRMSWLGRSEACYDRIMSYDETVRSIDAVDAQAIGRVAEDLFDRGSYAVAAIGPAGPRIMAASGP